MANTISVYICYLEVCCLPLTCIYMVSYHIVSDINTPHPKGVIIRQLKTSFLEVVFDVDHDFEGLRAPEAHRKYQTVTPLGAPPLAGFQTAKKPTQYFAERVPELPPPTVHQDCLVYHLRRRLPPVSRGGGSFSQTPHGPVVVPVATIGVCVAMEACPISIPQSTPRDSPYRYRKV